MKKILTLLITLILGTNLIFAQSVGINSDGSAPASSAMLDVSSTAKGFLAPRMTAAQKAAITSPATGLLVYQTDAPAGYYYNSGTPATPSWTQIGAASGSSQWTTNGSNIYYNTGNVGVGTASPTYLFHLKSSIPYLAFQDTDDPNGSIGTITQSQDGGVYMDANVNNTATTGSFKFRANGAANTRMVIDNTGNVGIGTATPVSKLHIASADPGASLLLENTSANTGNNYLMFKAQGANQGYIGLGSSWANNMYLASYGTSSINLSTNSLERLIVLANGNVGIGTTTPYTTLTVGSTDATAKITAGGPNTNLTLASAGPNGSIYLNAGGVASGNYSTSTRLSVGADGNVGIGTTTPSSPLQIKGVGEYYTLRLESTTTVGPGIRFQGSGTYDGKIWSINAGGSGNPVGANKFVIYDETAGLARMTINTDGNVGIGTTTPLHPLHMGSGAHVTTAGVWTDASDARLKTNIVNTNYGLQTVMQLRPVNYNMVKGGEAQVGFIAQEVQKIVPEVVSGTEGDITKGETLGLSYGNLVPVLTKAIQEQQALIEKLQAENAAMKAKVEIVDNLKAENAAIKTDLEELKNAVYGTAKNQ